MARVLFNRINFTLNKGDKIALVAEDPLAVTAFFEIINGEMKADNGKYEWGTTVNKAYLPNENSQFFTGNDLTLMDWLRQYVPPHVTDVDEPFLRGFLGKMLFSGDEVLKKTSRVKWWRKSALHDQPNDAAGSQSGHAR